MSQSIQIVSPVDGQPHSRTPRRASQDVFEAGLRARRRSSAYGRGLPLADRQAICRRFMELFADQHNQVADELARLMGRPVSVGGGEVRRSARATPATWSTSPPKRSPITSSTTSTDSTVRHHASRSASCS